MRNTWKDAFDYNNWFDVRVKHIQSISKRSKWKRSRRAK